MSSTENEFTALAAEAREETNRKLAEELAAITPIKADELAAMLPTPGDKEEFARLMEAVNAATTHNEKVAAIRSNLVKFTKQAAKLIKTALR